MRRKYQILLLLLILTPSIRLFSQDGNETLLSIGTVNVSRAEFERIYHKNNSALKSTDQKSLNDYLELFINFKLKVLEAENLKLDTSAAFKTELAGYRDQLAKSYLSSEEQLEQFVKEAYERSKWEIDASHILIRCDENASAEDTLIAYNKIQEIWQRLKKGEDFSSLASKLSEDPSTLKTDGHIGYFTTFQMVYQFETIAHATAIGSFSAPFRSKFGYHILKVLNRVPSRGELKASHIMKAFPQGSNPEQIEKARKEIYSLYDSLKNGADFAKLAKKYSDDTYSGNNGGDLGWFSVGRMIPEFENVAFSIKNKGEYSQPFKTKFGWHIVKLIDRKTIASYEESKEKLKQMVKRDDRSKIATQIKINSIKKEYGFTENVKNLEPYYTLIDTSSKVPWKKEKAAGLNSQLFTIGTKSVSQAGFTDFLTSRIINRHIPAVNLVNSFYKDYVNSVVLDYEKGKLEAKFPDFRYLMQEYHDGILLFDLTDKTVWSKALKDSSGLSSFYSSIIQVDSIRKKYMWKDRVQAVIYSCSNDTVAKLARIAAAKREKNNLGKEFIYKSVSPKDSLHKSIKIEEGKYEKGDNNFIDQIRHEPGLSENLKKDGRVVFVYIQKRVSPGLKTLDEARGLATADYQDKLEKLWIASLRQKYTVTVNKDILLRVK